MNLDDQITRTKVMLAYYEIKTPAFGYVGYDVTDYDGRAVPVDKFYVNLAAYYRAVLAELQELKTQEVP